jgi:hypothetical protein
MNKFISVVVLFRILATRTLNVRIACVMLLRNTEF